MKRRQVSWWYSSVRPVNPVVVATTVHWIARYSNVQERYLQLTFGLEREAVLKFKALLLSYTKRNQQNPSRNPSYY